MSTYLLYFSPTGSTQRVTQLLAGELGPLSPIDLSLRDADFGSYAFAEDDVCFVGVPAYGGRVPAVALERLRQMKAQNTPAVLIATYGNRAIDDTLLELKNELVAQGFRPVAAVAAVTEHSIMHQYGANRPDEADLAELGSFALRLKEALAQGAELPAVAVPGSQPYREYKGVPLKPSAGKKCTGCKACAAGCPVGAIPEEKPAATDTDRCISCMRCIAVCPAHARALSPMMLAVASQTMKKVCQARKENQLFL